MVVKPAIYVSIKSNLATLAQSAIVFETSIPTWDYKFSYDPTW